MPAREAGLSTRSTQQHGVPWVMVLEGALV